MSAAACALALALALVPRSCARSLAQAPAGPAQVADSLQLRQAIIAGRSQVHLTANVTVSLASFPGVQSCRCF